MINLEEVRAIQRQKIDEKYKEELVALESEIESQKLIFDRMLNAQATAEQEFPDELQTIEDRIRRVVKGGMSNVVHYTIGESPKDTFLVSLLIPTLTLSGFVCRLKPSVNKLEISW